MTRFVQSDRSQPFLMPPDLREWVPEDDLCHFIVEAVERVDIGKFNITHRGTGSEQYDPRVMLALLIYCYANRIFASRRIEKATHRDVVVRFVAANTHPCFDTICTFLRENFAAIEETFLQVLTIAKELKILKAGTVSVDGTKIDANANIHKSVGYDRATELRDQLKLEVAELMKKAETAGAAGEKELVTNLPAEIVHREKLPEKWTRSASVSRPRPRWRPARSAPTSRKGSRFMRIEVALAGLPSLHPGRRGRKLRAI